MKNRRDIKSEMAYFYTAIKNMDKKDSIKNSKIQEHEISIEDVIYDKESENIDIENQAFEKNLLGWIELIENENLHSAIRNLSIEDQIFISYIVKECKTQEELSKKYKVTQSAICQRFCKLIKTMKKEFLKNFPKCL